MHCTPPLPSAASRGWSFTHTCTSRPQPPRRRDSFLMGAIVPKRRASIHAVQKACKTVRRLLEAQLSRLVLTHHSEAFWGSAGLVRNRALSLARNSFLTQRQSVKAEKPTGLPSQSHGHRSNCMGSTALGYWRLELGSRHHQPDVLPYTENLLFSQPQLNCSICNAEQSHFPSFLYFQ